MRLIRSIFFLLYLFLISVNTFGQDLKIKLSKSSSITTADVFTIALIVPKELKKEFNTFPYSSFPEIENFIKYKTEIEKNKDEKIFIITQYYIPVKTGQAQLNAFALKVGDEKIYSSGRTFFIREAAKPYKAEFPEKLDFKEEDLSIKFFITSDKKEIYAGEGFNLTAGLLIGEENEVKFQFKDLLTQTTNAVRNITPPNCFLEPRSKGIIQNPTFDSITIKNSNYKKLNLFEARYYPVNAENISIPKYTFTIIRYRIAREENVFWWKAEDLKLVSPSFEIKVKELPNHPLQDVVPVGKFQLKEWLSTTKITTGKSFNYTAYIKGDGNLQHLLSPLQNDVSLFEIYPMRVKSKEENHIEEKIFEYKIIAKEPGKFGLSNYFYWVYFDPEKRHYDTLKSKITFKVSGESLKEKEKSPPFKGSFYDLPDGEKNKLRSKERDESIKFFANIIILFMLVTTAILAFKR